MPNSSNESDQQKGLGLAAYPAIELALLAHGLGLLAECPDTTALTIATMQPVLQDIQDILEITAALSLPQQNLYDELSHRLPNWQALFTHFPSALPSQLTSMSEEEMRVLFTCLLSFLEGTNFTAYEWPGLREIMTDDQQLASLLDVPLLTIQNSHSALATANPEVANRLHYIARICTYISGSYHGPGMRKWFNRPRGDKLGGKFAGEILKGNWSPKDEGAVKVMELARATANS